MKGWLDKYQDGGFLQPNDPKLPATNRTPYRDLKSSEVAMSIGGENGEPAYLIPSFKRGEFLKNPLEEYRKTGEHLGGPFKTWQEADKWEQEVRHPYVEKGQALPTPLKRWGKDFKDGGKMQEHQPNFNNSSVSIPKEFVGQGYNTKGRNYSPAWGGQFEDGGKFEKIKKWWSEYKNKDLSGNPIDPKSHEPYRASWKQPINLTWGQAADSLQKGLDNPGGALLKALEPTGTFSYGDVKKAWGDDKFTMDDVIEPLGAIPVVGKIPKVIKYAGQALKGLDFVEDLYKSIPKKEMGGSIPGSVGFQYARHGAPSEGKHAKKTLPSAKEGSKLQLIKLDQLTNFTNYNKKQPGGWLDKYK